MNCCVLCPVYPSKILSFHAKHPRLCKNNYENKLALLDYSYFLTTFIGKDYFFSECLTVIIKDFKETNVKIEFVKELVAEHLKSFKETQNYEIFKFFAAVCENFGVSDLPEFIQDFLIKNNENLLILPQIKENSFVFEKNIRLEDCFDANFAEKDEKLENLYKTLIFFGSLCESRNYLCINTIKTLMPGGILLEYIKNPQIPNNFRAQFLNIFMKTEIDVYPRFVSNFPGFIYKYDKNINEKMNSSSKIVPNFSANEDYSLLRSLQSQESAEDESIKFITEYILNYIQNLQISENSIFETMILKTTDLMIHLDLFKEFQQKNKKGTNEKIDVIKALVSIILKNEFYLGDFKILPKMKTTSENFKEISSFNIDIKYALDSSNSLEKYSIKFLS